MDNMIDYSGKLDFNEIDLTAPDKVVAEILSHLPEATNNYVSGKIEPYDGLIESISNDTFSVLAKSIGQVGQYDVQEDLGASGEESKEFECYLYTPIYEHYKFRVFFMQYNLSHYPVKLVIEKSVAQNMSNSSNYIIKCKDRQSLEEMIMRILNSKRVVDIIQEIIWINQAKKSDQLNNETDCQ